MNKHKVLSPSEKRIKNLEISLAYSNYKKYSGDLDKELDHWSDNIAYLIEYEKARANR